MKINKSMCVWELSAFGAQHLRLSELPTPQPGPKQILVRMCAASLNYRDKVVIDGSYLKNLKFPFIPVSDFAGEVVAVGAEVTRFSIGSRVASHYLTNWLDEESYGPSGERGPTLGAPLPGVLSDYVLLDEHSAVSLPDSLSYEEGATLPIAALTAWYALVESGGLKTGESVLVQGTGGVSIFAIQIAKALGARVIVLSSSDAKLHKVKELGANDGINYETHPDWEQEVLRLTGGLGVNHIIEVTGGRNLKRSIAATATGARIAVVGFLDGADSSLNVIAILQKRLRIHGISVGHRTAFEAMLSTFERNRIHPVIDNVYQFSSVPAAFEHLDRGAFGKIVIAGANR